MSKKQWGHGYHKGLESAKLKGNGSINANILDGKFFHSLSEERSIEWQGYILGSPEPGWYLVQLFEWFMGEPSLCKLVKFEDMTEWLFYQDQESMKHSYEYGCAKSYLKD